MTLNAQNCKTIIAAARGTNVFVPRSLAMEAVHGPRGRILRTLSPRAFNAFPYIRLWRHDTRRGFMTRHVRIWFLSIKGLTDLQV